MNIFIHATTNRKTAVLTLYSAMFSNNKSKLIMSKDDVGWEKVKPVFLDKVNCLVYI